MDKKYFYAKSKNEWRNWLKKNHKKEDMICLIRYKRHTDKPSPSVREAMDEAICFGWIDTTVKRIDDERYSICYRRRKKNAKWSNATQSYAKRLIKEKKMTPAGLAAYKLGLKKPTIDLGLPKNAPTPIALKEALAKNKKAKEFWENLAPSYRKYSIHWLERAKLKETKQKRIRAIVEGCKKGQKTPFLGKN